jgi:hypothetical protein
MIMNRIIAILALAVALPAWADKVGLPTSMPAGYVSECGSCHTPFPPALLSAADWKLTLAGLDKHFGTDASLDAKTAAELSTWLQANAGRRVETLGKSPRITKTAWFVRKHDEVPARIWQDSRVKSAANCAACHPNADKGGYSERELKVPGLGRHHERD